MTYASVSRLRRICSILLTAAILITALCLMAACIGIYRTGAYSREAVAAAFSAIAAPVYLCLFLIAGSIVLHLLCPVPRKAPAKRPAANRDTVRTVPSGKGKYLLLAAGMGLMLVGFLSGGTADVLTKAVNICTECIGLG